MKFIYSLFAAITVAIAGLGCDTSEHKTLNRTSDGTDTFKFKPEFPNDRKNEGPKRVGQNKSAVPADAKK